MQGKPSKNKNEEYMVEAGGITRAPIFFKPRFKLLLGLTNKTQSINITNILHKRFF